MSRLRMLSGFQHGGWLGGVRWDAGRRRCAGGRHGHGPATATTATTRQSTAVLLCRLPVRWALVDVGTRAPEVHRRHAAVSDSAAAAATDVCNKPGAGCRGAGLQCCHDDDLTRSNSTCQRQVGDDYDIVWQRFNVTAAGYCWRTF